ncbi:hypothetical protein GCM10027614_60840 [Micromonospora vulcania]
MTFRVTWQSADGYYDRLATQAAGGNVPDLIQLDDAMLTEYAQRQVILDLSERVADHRLDLRGLPEGLIRYGTVDGRTMAVAGGQTLAAVVFNRDLLKELRVPEPRSGMPWTDYIAWAEQVTEASDGQVAGTMDPSGDYRALWLWLRSQGGEFYRGRQLGFGPDELIGWFELWQRPAARGHPGRGAGRAGRQRGAGPATGGHRADRRFLRLVAPAARAAEAHQVRVGRGRLPRPAGRPVGARVDVLGCVPRHPPPGHRHRRDQLPDHER